MCIVLIERPNFAAFNSSNTNMKKIFTFTFALLVAISACAQKEVVVRPIPNGDPAPTKIPVVTYDDDVINITSEVNRPNTEVVITGKLGEVLYYGKVTLSTTQTTIVVPNTGISEKDTIELYCEDEEYYGEFEEE